MGNFARRDAAHLPQFRHQVGLGVQAARRIHDHRIVMPVLGRGEGIKEDRRRVRPGFLLDHLDAQPSCPNLQLLIGGGAEGVSGAEQGAAVLLQKVMGQLGDAGGFADAVYAHHKDDGRHARRRLLGFGGGGVRAGIFQNRQNPLFHGGAQLRRLPQLALADLLLQPAQNFLRRADPQVGGDEGRFQVVEHRFVQSRLALDNLLDPFNQLGFGGGDGLLQPIQKAGFLLFVFIAGTKQGDHRCLF